MAAPKKPRTPKDAKPAKAAPRGKARASEAQKDAVRRANVSQADAAGRKHRIERIRAKAEKLHALPEGATRYPLALIPPPPPKTPRQILAEYGIDALCEDVMGGASLRDIAEGLGVAYGSMHGWLAVDADRMQRIRDARTAAALAYDELALEALHDANPLVPGSVMQAKAIAEHYRWRAAKTNPRDFGEKLDITERRITEISDDELMKGLAKFGIEVPALEGDISHAAPALRPPAPGYAAGGNVTPIRRAA